jgi:hypothetical protein
MITPAVALWLVFRALRWLAWIAFIVTCVHFKLYPSSHLDSFGHLRPWTEVLFFGLGNAAIFLGMLELMMRERTGLARPSFGQLIPPRTTARAALPER